MRGATEAPLTHHQSRAGRSPAPSRRSPKASSSLCVLLESLPGAGSIPVAPSDRPPSSSLAGGGRREALSREAAKGSRSPSAAPRKYDHISPALDAPGGVLLLDASHSMRLRRTSLPDDAEASEIRRPYFRGTALVLDIDARGGVGKGVERPLIHHDLGPFPADLQLSRHESHLGVHLTFGHRHRRLIAVGDGGVG